MKLNDQSRDATSDAEKPDARPMGSGETASRSVIWVVSLLVVLVIVNGLLALGFIELLDMLGLWARDR